MQAFPLALVLLLQADLSHCEQDPPHVAVPNAGNLVVLEGKVLDGKLYSNSTDADDDDDEDTNLIEPSPKEDDTHDTPGVASPQVPKASANDGIGGPQVNPPPTEVSVDEDNDSPDMDLDSPNDPNDGDDFDVGIEHIAAVEGGNLDGHVDISDGNQVTDDKKNTEGEQVTDDGTSSGQHVGDVKASENSQAAPAASSSSTNTMLIGIVVGVVVPVVIILAAAMFWVLKVHQRPAMEQIFDVEVSPDRVSNDARPTASHSSTRSPCDSPARTRQPLEFEPIIEDSLLA